MQQKMMHLLDRIYEQEISKDECGISYFSEFLPELSQKHIKAFDCTIDELREYIQKQLKYYS